MQEQKFTNNLSKMLNSKNGILHSFTETDLEALVGIIVASVMFWTIICGCMCWCIYRSADGMYK